jgi:hypothetical protein
MFTGDSRLRSYYHQKSSMPDAEVSVPGVLKGGYAEHARLQTGRLPPLPPWH